MYSYYCCSLIQYCLFNQVIDLKQEHIQIMKVLMNVWKVKVFKI